MTRPDPVEIKRERAWTALLERLKGQRAIDIGPWTREELYERDNAKPVAPHSSTTNVDDR